MAIRSSSWAASLPTPATVFVPFPGGGTLCRVDHATRVEHRAVHDGGAFATLPGWPPPTQGQLDSVTTNPVQAATVWAANTWSVGQHHTLGIAATTGDGA